MGPTEPLLSSEPPVDSPASDKDLPSIPAAPSFSDTSRLRTIPAVPLTREAFAPFGDVIQAWSNPLSAPKGIRVTSANQGTAHKFHSLSRVVSSFPEHEATQTGPPLVSVFRSTPLAELAVPVPSQANTFTVKLLERHPYSNQIFIPMGTGVTRSTESDVLPEPATAYLVVVAKNGKGEQLVVGMSVASTIY